MATGDFALTLPQMRRAAELYAEGKSRRQVAAILGKSETATRSALRYLGTPLRPQHAASAASNRARKRDRVRRGSLTYNSWCSMKKRCKPDAHCREHYFDRGVVVCERWAGSFDNFLADMGERPAQTTLDRYPNPDGNYEPGNCRWATKREQAVNRKSTVWVEINGERKCLSDWADEFGISKRTVGSRLRWGWELTRAITTPARNYLANKGTP